ncbi:hypothetical protein RSOLAG1IB_05689 [Rhizoctonia solani AG-1 IB]|uniref:Uncharacterized protein n=1 Tax=Thanatephorus cucumeris (strain AG1-IB / isolate 7/3/14) TaxID=1108050 RepID=A0A0B7G486_THACB|nr:hypothetical protein RSOLAG1IB_05689 [Rhizoctonia solani AG-1 IB]
MESYTCTISILQIQVYACLSLGATAKRGLDPQTWSLSHSALLGDLMEINNILLFTLCTLKSNREQQS